MVSKWLVGEAQVNQSIVPMDLLPTVGKYGIQWPDICHCPVNGGPEFKVHALQPTCVEGVESIDQAVLSTTNGIPDPLPTWVCTCPDGESHLPNCPFDHCPVGQCHPMCAQVSGGTHVIGTESGEALFCHCPCHG